MRRIAFLSLTAGAGKSLLIYHLASMLADLGETVLVADLDPQANLTSMILAEERLEVLWSADQHPYSISGALRSMRRGEVSGPHVERAGPKIGVLVGDLALAAHEDKLSDAWTACMAGEASARSVVTSLGRVVSRAADAFNAAWVLIDTGASLDAITRSALMACESVVIPVAPDLYSYHGLRTLGPALRAWRSRAAVIADQEVMPQVFEPVGYVVVPYGMRESRPAKAFHRWLYRLPAVYRESVLDMTAPGLPASADEDPHCLAVLKDYRSLFPMALKARKPIFALTPADGAIGAHADAARLAFSEFHLLARRLARAYAGAASSD